MQPNNPKVTVVIPFKSDSDQVTNLLLNISNIVALSHSLELRLIIDYRMSDKSDDNVRLISEVCPAENLTVQFCGSVGAARNLGLAQALTPWVTFCDADDISHVGTLLKLIKQASSEKYDLLVGRFAEETVEKRAKEATTSPIISIENMEGQLSRELGIWRFVFRTALAQRVEFPTINMGEDQVYMLGFFALDPKVMTSNEVIYTYIKGYSESLTNQKKTVRKVEEAVPLSIQALKRGGNSWIYFREALVLNLMLTNIKHAKWIRKPRAVFNMFRFVAGSNRLYPRGKILLEKLSKNE